METICIKIEDKLLGRMNKDMEETGYSTKTEFIREAIRKKLEEDERERLIKEFLKFKGRAKKQTTYEENRKTKKIVSKELMQELDKRFS